MRPVLNVHCSRCGKRCSGVDPELGLVVRAWVECPECLEAHQGAVEDVGPPGRWICPTCGFSLTKAILRAHDGAVGVDASPVQDICVNDGTSLRQVTWKEDAEDANRVGLEQMKCAEQAEAELTTLRAGIVRLVQEWRDKSQSALVHYGDDVTSSRFAACADALAALEPREEQP